MRLMSHLAMCRKPSALQATSESAGLKDLQTQMTFRRARACELDDEEQRIWEPYKPTFNGKYEVNSVQRSASPMPGRRTDSV